MSTNNKSLNLSVRKMEISDLDSVLEIENTSFENPWKKEHFLVNLADRDDAKAWIAETDERVVGFIIAWYIPGYSGFKGESHIHNIAVLPEYRRKKIGKQLIGRAIRFGWDRGCMEVTLEVRESNIGAQKFYEKLGFRVVGHRQNYYENEDALIMEGKSINILDNIQS